jgi:hypothetical protein
MRVASFERVAGALAKHEVRYLLVGGMAAIAHGLNRTTVDLDFVVQLAPDNVRRAMMAFAEIGYRPQAPVRAEDFADSEIRRQWIVAKQMIVFQLVADVPDAYPVDVFVAEPFDFDREWATSPQVELAPDLFVPVLNLPRLLALKLAAGRPNDLDDVRRLQKLFPDVEPAD